MTFLKIAGLAAALSLVSAAALAAPPILVEGSSQPTATVSYADLHLGKPAGRATLEGRVRRAAGDLCRQIGVISLRQKSEEKGCMTFAIASARQQIEQAVADFGSTRYAGRREVVLAVR